MKTTILSLLGTAALATSAFASAGPGPWANATWYPGNLDGKYQAAVYGNNISGVLGFALANGSPTIATNSTIVNTNGSSQSTLVMNPFQNYFAIFVEGRTYTGSTLATANYDNSTLTGALIGAQPDFTLDDYTLTTATAPLTNVVQTITVIGTTNITTITNTGIFQTNITSDGTNLITNVTEVLATNTATLDVLETNFTTNVTQGTIDSDYKAFNPLALINRGLNGGFRAQITGNGGVFTFVGDGELSTPAQAQVVNVARDNIAIVGNIIGTQIDTETVPFKLNGIRVSFSTSP